MSKKGEYSRAPKHQNTFAFKHNPKSKLTEQIAKMPNEGLCKKCWDKVEWKKKYRKYKPLSQPAACRDCSQRTVTAAYHRICQSCAKSKGVCAWCTEGRDIVNAKAKTLATVHDEIERTAAAEGMPLRQKKTLLRAADRKFARRKESEEAGEEAEPSEEEGEGGSDGGDDEFDDLDMDDFAGMEESKGDPR